MRSGESEGVKDADGYTSVASDRMAVARNCVQAAERLVELEVKDMLFILGQLGFLRSSGRPQPRRGTPLQPLQKHRYLAQGTAVVVVACAQRCP